MTVSTTDSEIDYTGNGVTTAFPVPFRFLQSSDLVVTRVATDGTSVTLALGTDYTVTGAGDQSGGTITATVAPASGVELNISRVLTAVQETDLRNQGRYYAETLEDALDYLTMLDQQNVAGLGRALKRPLGASYFDAEGRLISNVADPVSIQDAATMGWAKNFFSSLIDGVVGAINTTTGIFYDSGTLFDYLRFGLNRTVDSVAALRALVATRNQRAMVLGYYAKGDGGGGAYYLDTTDTTSADNGGTIIVATDGSRWKLTFQDHVTTAQFGARLAGTSADDGPFIQAALTWAKTAGVPVVMPAGRHVIATHVSIPTGVSFSGVSSFMPINYLGSEQTGSVLLIKHGAGLPDGPFTFGIQTGATFRNFRIIYPDQTLTNPPVGYPYLIGGEVDAKGLYNDILVERLFILNAYRFASFTAQNGRICIQDIFADVYNTGIKMDNGLDCNYIRRIHFWAYSDLTATTAQQNALRAYKTANLIGMLINRADGLFITDYFLIFGKVGLQLGAVGQVPYGMITNLSFDAVQYGVYALYVGVQSLTITNMDYAMSSVIMTSFNMVDSAPVLSTLQMGTLLINNLCVWTEASYLVNETPAAIAGGTVILNNPFIADTISKRLVFKQGAGDVIVRDLRVVKTSDNLLCNTTGTVAAKFINPDFYCSASAYSDGAGPAPRISSADDGTETSIASAAQIAIPAMPQKKKFLITGSVTISAANIRPAGEEIEFRFAAPCTINIGATFKIGTNFVGTTGSTLSLVSDGTYWVQRSRFIL